MIPMYSEIKDLIRNDYNHGNFGLWFYKFVEVDENNKFKVPQNAVDTYKTKYSSLSNNIVNLLNKKHEYQEQFCSSFGKCFKVLVFEATAKTPFVTGIGETHPSEIGMTFDHNMGVPYIPSSSIKGVVRFAHTISLIDEAIEKNSVKNDEFDDEEDWTRIPKIFGKGGDDGNIGRVIFLDAYPVEIPKLKPDIMNPHYEPYYSKKGENRNNQNNEKPAIPADYHNPVPIKFLTVDKGAKFILRIMINKNFLDLEGVIRKAIIKAFEQEGVGAKTSVGYGRFVLKELSVKENKQDTIQEKVKTQDNYNSKKIEHMTEVEKIIYKLKNEKNEEFANDIINKRLDSFEEEDKKLIANALKEFWKKINKWEMKGISDKQKKKVEKVKSILGEK